MVPVEASPLYLLAMSLEATIIFAPDSSASLRMSNGVVPIVRVNDSVAKR